MNLTKEQLMELSQLFHRIGTIFESSVDVVESTNVIVENEVVDTVVEKVENKKEEKEKTKKEVNEEIASKEVTTDIDSLNYNELKRMAKDLGLSAKGTKPELIFKIKEKLNLLDEQEEVEDIEEIKEGIDEVSEVLDEETDGVDDEESSEDFEHTLYDKVVEYLEEYSDEELREILESIEKSTKGNRQTLIALIVQAIEDGELEFELDDEEVEEDDLPFDFEENEESEYEYDLLSSDVRFKKAKQVYKHTMEQIDNSIISPKEISKFLKKYHNNQWSGTEEESFEEYARVHSELVDVEGNVVELEEAYAIDNDYEVYYCCGKKLKEVDEDLYCEVCGTTYGE